MAYQMMVSGNGSSSSSWQIMYLPYADTTYTKLFVGGLAWETKSETLHRYFEQFGDILEAVVIIDKRTGRSKGYGFVTFSDPEAAKRACADPNPVIDGRRANCNIASLGRSQQFSPYGHLRPAMMPYSMRSHMMRGPYVGSPAYQQPFGYGYHPGFQSPSLRFPAYRPEYIYPQVYTMPSSISADKMSYRQAAPPPSSIGYATSQGYPTPSPNIIPYNISIVGGPTAETSPATQVPYHSGLAVPSPGQQQTVVPTGADRFIQNDVSNQMTS